MSTLDPVVVGLEPTRFHVYVALERRDEPASISALARQCDLHRDTVRDALDDLEAEGLAEERLAVDDRRRRVFALVE